MNFLLTSFVLFSTILAGCVIAGPLETIDRGNFGPFERSLNTRAHGYQLVEDPVGTFSGQQIERFEVREGDCSSNAGWSDCKNDRERSELRELTVGKNEGTTSWYSWSFYVPSDWPSVFPTKTVLGQFHQIGSHPVWMFLHQDGGLYLDDQSTGYSTRKALLIPADEFSNVWHKIEVQVKWTADDTGFLKIWVNNRQRFVHEGKTMSADTVYFRYGVYRSFLSRFKNANDTDVVPTQVAYFTNVRKSSARICQFC